MAALYTPLYPPEGAPVTAFACNYIYECSEQEARYCGKVTRTERGMKLHCSRVHGLKQQIEMFEEKT